MNEIERARKDAEDRAVKVGAGMVARAVGQTTANVLNRHGGSIIAAAKELGIEGRELVELIEEYGLMAEWTMRNPS